MTSIAASLMVRLTDRKQMWLTKIIFPTPDLVNTWNYLRQQGAQ